MKPLLVAVAVLCGLALVISHEAKEQHGRNLDFRSQPRFGYRKRRSDQLPGHVELAIGQLLKEVTQLTATVTSLSHNIEQLKQQNADLQQKNADLQQQANGLQMLNSALGMKLDAAEGKMAAQNASTQLLESELASLRSETSRVTTLQNNSLENMRKDLSAFYNDLTALEATQNATASKVAEHTNKIVSLGGGLALVQNDVIIIKTDVMGIHSDITTVESSQININMRMTQQSDRVTYLQQNMTLAEARLAQAESSAAKLQIWKNDVMSDVMTLNMTQFQQAKDFNDMAQGILRNTRLVTRLDGTMMELGQRFEYSTTSVMFYASLRANQEWPQPPPPSPIILDEVSVNNGQSYNDTSGNFTAPVDGDYYISAMSKGVDSSVGAGSPVVELMVDDTQVHISDPSHPMLDAALTLRAGQTVWLRSYFASRYAKGTYFTGFLIRASLTPFNVLTRKGI